MPINTKRRCLKLSITAKELAKILNLSPAAISMALNNKPGVSTKTKHKIIDTAKQYGFDFSKLEYKEQNSPLKGTLNLIIYKKSGAVISDSPFFTDVFEGVNEGCKAYNYNLNIKYVYDREDAESSLKEIEPNTKGIILLGTEMMPSDYEPFSKFKLPIVVLDTYFETINSNYVLINNTQGAYLATNFLIKRCKSQPGYLRSAYPIGNFNERANGFYQALRANGMSPSKSIVHSLSPTIDGAYADMCCFLDQHEDLASCYFADNDVIACAAIKAFKEYGYQIPNDISVIGFDDTPVCNYIVPTLTTIQVSKQYLGKTAAARLVQIIDEKQYTYAKIEISTQLIVRNSVK